MPTFENPAADADDVQAALRALAHATRSIEDPRQIYSVLGSLTSALASLSQSLHQLAAVHDGQVKDDVGGGRLPCRAGGEASGLLGSPPSRRDAPPSRRGRRNAHNTEATITYARRDLPALGDHPRQPTDHGLSL